MGKRRGLRHKGRISAVQSSQPRWTGQYKVYFNQSCIKCLFFSSNFFFVDIYISIFYCFFITVSLIVGKIENRQRKNKHYYSIYTWYVHCTVYIVMIIQTPMLYIMRFLRVLFLLVIQYKSKLHQWMQLLSASLYFLLSLN